MNHVREMRLLLALVIVLTLVGACVANLPSLNDPPEDAAPGDDTPESRNLISTSTYEADSGLRSDRPAPMLWDGDREHESYQAGTDTSERMWVEFDLGSEHVITSVRLFGDDEGSWVSRIATVEAHDGSGWATLIEDEPVDESAWFEWDVDATAERIRLTVDGASGSGSVQVREFEVHGYPVDGDSRTPDDAPDDPPDTHDFRLSHVQPDAVTDRNTAGSGSRGLRMASEPEVYTTLHSIGIEWDLEGDTDHDAQAKVWYRRAGADTWKQAQDLLRIDFTYEDIWIDSDYAERVGEQRQNRFAGSIFFLAPDVSYEVFIEAADPDGGSASERFTVRTEPVPEHEAQRTIYARPGDGGGSGTRSDPYRGIEEALSHARAGDDVVLLDGNYGKAQIRYAYGAPGAYIRLVADNPHAATIERLRLFDSEYLWFEQLTFENYPEAAQTQMRQKRTNDLRDLSAIRAWRVDHVVIVDNVFDRYHNAIQLNTGERHDHWYVVNNRIEGDNHNQAIGYSLSGEGVDLGKSSHHTVAFNTIHNTADGVSFPGRNVDIFANRIYETNDDSVETDMGLANVRVWGNELGTAAEHSLSFQSQIAGPWYFIRNEIINPEIAVPELTKYPGPSKIMKYASIIDRHVLYQNTIHTVGTWSGYMAQPWLLATAKNNIISFDEDVDVPFEYDESWSHERNEDEWYRPMPSYYHYDHIGWMHDHDHNGYVWDGTFAEWHGEDVSSFDELRSEAGFKSSYERGGLRLSPADFVNYEDLDLRISSSSDAHDAGIWLPNINDDYAGDAPDLGSYEVGGVQRPAGYQAGATLEELHEVWSFNG